MIAVFTNSDGRSLLQLQRYYWELGLATGDKPVHASDPTGMLPDRTGAEIRSGGYGECPLPSTRRAQRRRSSTRYM